MFFIIFSPTILMLLSVPLWYVERISNEVLRIVALLALAIPALFVLFNMESAGTGSIGVGIFMAIVVFVANAFQFLFYLKTLSNNRCPYCHKMGLKLLRKSVEGSSRTVTTSYQYKGFKDRYATAVEYIRLNTTYNLWCPKCKEQHEWTDEDKDTLRTKEYKIK